MSNHNPLCQQAMDIDPEVPNCICDWVDAAERDTEARIIKLLYTKREELAEIVSQSEMLWVTDAKWFYQDRVKELDRYIALIRGKAE